MVRPAGLLDLTTRRRPFLDPRLTVVSTEEILLVAGLLDNNKDDQAATKENVTVTVRFRPLSPREIRQWEEVAWYADGDTVVRSKQNPNVGYAYDRVFAPTTTTRQVYDVAAQHVVSGAMEGIYGLETMETQSKAAAGNGEDRLSELPNDLLLNILERVGMLDAADLQQHKPHYIISIPLVYETLYMLVSVTVMLSSFDSEADIG
ncbi:kinesin-related protein 4 [Hordeum vulgare]|nr:kinesin-related protein 4 [Hordeum vulgare]